MVPLDVWRIKSKWPFQGRYAGPAVIFMNQRLLFLRATCDYSPEVIAHIKAASNLVGVEFVEHSFVDTSTFEAFAINAGQFDFLYVAAHANHTCFGDKAPITHTRWADFGQSLCCAQLMKPGSVLFLGCCHGGLKRVSLILFNMCRQVVSVCGPRWKVSTQEAAVGIHVFLYNLIIAEEEPTVAAERTAAALGSRFPFYNRYDLEADIAIMAGLHESEAPDYYPTQIQELESAPLDEPAT